MTAVASYLTLAALVCGPAEGLWLTADGETICAPCPTAASLVLDADVPLPGGCAVAVPGVWIHPDAHSTAAGQRAASDLARARITAERDEARQALDDERRAHADDLSRAADEARMCADAIAARVGSPWPDRLAGGLVGLAVGAAAMWALTAAR